MAHFRMQERDLDLILLEELHAGNDFASWLAERIGLKGHRFTDAEHSVSAKLDAKWGETDVLAFFVRGTERVAVLIEDKIAASFQERQAERYHERGRALVSEGRATHYRTVLVAPKSYLRGVPADDPWDVQLAIDDVRNWFAMQQGSHGRWRADALSACIERLGRSLSSGEGAVSRFSAEFSEYLAVNFAGSFRHSPQKSENSWGLMIDFPGRGPGIWLVWKVNQSCVDLTCERRHIGKLATIPDHVGAVFLPSQSTDLKSDTLRIHVGSASWAEPLTRQLDIVSEVITACERLRPIAIEVNGLPT